MISSAWLPHPVPAGCRSAGRQGEGKGPGGELSYDTPSLHRHHFVKRQGGICPARPCRPHSNAAGLLMGPGVKLFGHEEFPIIRGNMEKRGRHYLGNRLFQRAEGRMAVLTGCGRDWDCGWVRQLSKAPQGCMAGTGDTEVKNTLSLFSRRRRQHRGLTHVPSALTFHTHQRLLNANLTRWFCEHYLWPQGSAQQHTGTGQKGCRVNPLRGSLSSGR